MKTKILHLSDLHINTKKADHDQLAVINALCRDIKNQSDVAPFDYIFFTGDLVGKGTYADGYEKMLMENFVDPVLKASNLPMDNLIFCPGNHDVELSARNKIFERGLESLILDKRSINEFISDHAEHPDAFKALSKYNDFAKKFGVAHNISRSPLMSTFVLESGNKKIGVASLNSAWRATGAPNDRDCGLLIVGERQVELAAERLKRCDFKIVLLHHPLNWISPKEHTAVQRAIARNFDLLLHGHIHEGDGVSLVTPNNNLIVSGAGCLYQSREYFNGYSILELSWAEEKFCQVSREYYSSRDEFGRSERLAENGAFSAPLNGEESENFILPEKSVSRIEENVNRQLISSAISNVAPGDIHDVFVDPKLSTKPSNELDADTLSNRKEVFLSPLDIEGKKSNFFIWGRNESGKTTLLNYLAVRATRATALTGIVAFYIDARLMVSLNAAVSGMISFCDGAFKRSEVERALMSGRAVVYIDNCSVDAKTDEFSVLQKLLETYPKAKFVLTAEESKRFTLVETKLPQFAVEFTELFLLPFTRKQVRSLISNWFGDQFDQSSQILEGVLHLTNKLQLPRSPFLMSMVLWLREKDIAFSPVNYASLIENFIDGLLEKLKDTNFRAEVYTFRIKQHFLSELAAKMSEFPQKSISRLSLDQHAVEYFQARPQPNAKPLELIDHFLRRGILLEVGDQVRFKLECFREYFVAKRLLDNREYLNRCLLPENLVNYFKELDYYTALKQDDVEVLRLALKRVEETSIAVDLGIESHDYARLDAHETSIMNLLRDRVHELIEAKPSKHERESIMDDLDEQMVMAERNSTSAPLSSRTVEQNEVLVNYTDSYANYLRHVMFCSIVLRNSELVGDVDIIRKGIRDNLEHWARNCIFMLAQFDILGEELKGEAQLESRGPIHGLIRSSIPIAFSGLIKEYLGTAKLAEILRAYFVDEKTGELPALFALILYVDLTLPKYIEEVNDFLLRGLQQNSRDFIFNKILSMYFVRNLTPHEQQKMEELLAELAKGYVAPNVKLPKNSGEFISRLRERVRLARAISPDSVQDK